MLNDTTIPHGLDCERLWTFLGYTWTYRVVNWELRADNRLDLILCSSCNQQTDAQSGIVSGGDRSCFRIFCNVLYTFKVLTGTGSNRFILGYGRTRA